jgi:zinc transporter ZupT
MLILTAIAALAFIAVHLFIGRLTFLEGKPRHALLSFAGGVAVAYIFLHVLPELAAHQQTFAHELDLSDSAAEAWVYLVSLAGLVVFFGLESAARRSRGRRLKATGESRLEREVKALHLGSFFFFNFLIGYLLLHREQTGYWSLAIYAAAMLLHLATSDFGQRQEHAADYDAETRWVLVAGIAAGWLVGALDRHVPEIVIGFLFAFLAGGVILNTLKEELPEDKDSRFLPFAAGTAAYAVLLLVLR